jgi:hypothetical protein
MKSILEPPVIDISFSKYIDLQNFISALDYLDYGYYGFSILGVYSIIIFGIIYFSLYKKFTWLNLKARKVLKYFYILLLTILFIIYCYNLLDIKILDSFKYIKFIVFLFLHFLISTERILDIFIRSVFESIILYIFVSIIKNEIIDYKSAINRSFIYLKAVFIFNLFISIADISISLSLGIMTAQDFTGIGVELFNSISYLFDLIYRFSNHILKTLNVIFILFPIIYIYNELNIKKALRRNIEFVFGNITKYAVFIFFGILIFYFSILLYQIPADYIGGRYSLFEPLISTGANMIRLFLAVLFYIAFFKFYIDTQQKADQRAIV